MSHWRPWLRKDAIAAAEREWNIRDVVVTTILHRSNRMGQTCEMARVCALDIAARITVIIPEGLSDESMIDFVISEIEREEFSLCEDVLDGSAA